MREKYRKHSAVKSHFHSLCDGLKVISKIYILNKTTPGYFELCSWLWTLLYCSLFSLLWISAVPGCACSSPAAPQTGQSSSKGTDFSWVWDLQGSLSLSLHCKAAWALGTHSNINSNHKMNQNITRGLIPILIMLSTDLSRKLRWKKHTYPSYNHRIQGGMEDIPLYYL